MQKAQWQNELINAFFTIKDLFEFLEIDLNKHRDYIDSSAEFPIRVPRHFAAKMEKGNINDPLLKQVLPLNLENEDTAGFTLDPVGDLAANKQEGLIHKYENRVLLSLTGNCAVHCRYCFRRHFPYESQAFNKKRFQTILEYLSKHTKLDEVILSGGDPLSLSDENLKYIFNKIDQIKHIRTLRIHTRFPVVLPSRITPQLISNLKSLSKRIVFVFHVNHQNELCSDIKASVTSLKEINITVLNQSVLLKDINNEVGKLKNLSETLFSHGILPYYIHHLDKVKGAAHFQLDRKKSIDIINELKTKMSGYLVPTFVEEIAGEKSKTLVF